MTYKLLHALWYLLSLLPFRVLYGISDGLYLILYHGLKYRRRVIWKNISESFPDKTPEEQEAIIRSFYHWLCDYFVETIKLMSLSPKTLKKRMVFTGIETLNAYSEAGRSCALYLGHYGQWEWISSLPLWMSPKAIPLQVYHVLENPLFDRLMLHARQRQGAVSVPIAETLRRVASYNQQKQPIVIGYIADQVPFWNNIHHWVDFLHHDTPVLTGSERIIKRMNEVPFYCEVSRVRRGYYRCDLKLMTDDPQHYPDYALTDQYFRLLEQNILRDPALYLWSHNRWKRTREEYNLRYDEETGRVDLGPLEEILARKQKATSL